MRTHNHKTMLRANDDVIDRNMNQLYEKSNEAHDGKSDRCGHGNFLELCNLGIRISFIFCLFVSIRDKNQNEKEGPGLFKQWKYKRIIRPVLRITKIISISSKHFYLSCLVWYIFLQDEQNL